MDARVRSSCGADLIFEKGKLHTVSTGNGSTNGAARYQDDKVRVAIIGVGNCASSFVQGVHYYRDTDPAESVPGLMHVDLGGYHVRDIEFTRRLRHRRRQGRQGPLRGDLRGPEQHDRSSTPRSPSWASRSSAG